MRSSAAAGSTDRLLIQLNGSHGVHLVLGVSAIAIQGDVSKPADITRLSAAAVERFGKIDIVVANAWSST
jgi:NAD(P)-dependent dehydrogenase (short-subunit alcohol dehydrogenase family)